VAVRSTEPICANMPSMWPKGESQKSTFDVDLSRQTSETAAALATEEHESSRHRVIRSLLTLCSALIIGGWLQAASLETHTSSCSSVFKHVGFKSVQSKHESPYIEVSFYTVFTHDSLSVFVN
jgi:hypothetical protein